MLSNAHDLFVVMQNTMFKLVKFDKNSILC